MDIKYYYTHSPDLKYDENVEHLIDYKLSETTDGYPLCVTIKQYDSEYCDIGVTSGSTILIKFVNNIDIIS